MPIDVFISYARTDRELRDKLANQLSGLRNQGVINDWFDGEIIAGTEWESQIIDHLDTAQIILLLISADFLASNFCYNVEMKRALDRHDAGLVRVIPVILRPTDWKSAPFAKLKVLPADGKAAILWAVQDEAFVDVVEGIKRAIHDLQDRALQAVNKTGGVNIHVDPDQQNAKAQGQSARVQPSPAQSGGTNNSIGSIGGERNRVYQARTVNNTVTNYYGRPSSDVQSKDASMYNAGEEERHGAE